MTAPLNYNDIQYTENYLYNNYSLLKKYLMTFKEQDRCIIVKNTSKHNFEIGEEVVIINVSEDGDSVVYIAGNKENYWYLYPEELEALPLRKPYLLD